MYGAVDEKRVQTTTQAKLRRRLPHARATPTPHTTAGPKPLTLTTTYDHATITHQGWHTRLITTPATTPVFRGPYSRPPSGLSGSCAPRYPPDHNRSHDEKNRPRVVGASYTGLDKPEREIDVKIYAAPGLVLVASPPSRPVGCRPFFDLLTLFLLCFFCRYRLGVLGFRTNTE